MEGGFIKISRKMLDWEWYTDGNTMRLFFHCLLKANWKDGRFRGVEVPRGSFITSLPSLSEETNMSIKQVRAAIDHLKATGEVAVRNYPHWRMITVVKYNDYQDKGSLEGSQRAVKGQSKGSQRASIEEYKKNKNIKNGKKEANPALKNIEDLYLQGVKNDL